MNRFGKLCSGALVLGVCGHASAVTTWTLTGTPSGVTVSAYANTGNVAGGSAANHANNGAIQTIQPATLHSYSGGIGITNADACASGSKCDRGEGSTPEHSIDNQQRYDMALLSFPDTVKLTAARLGWMSNDSDITVMAYVGAGAPTTASGVADTNFVGLTYSQLISKGWAAIGNYANVGTAAPVALNAAGIISSYWLIGAYNPLANPFGAVFNSSSYDYVKFTAVSGYVASIPTPGSFALVAFALIAMFGVINGWPPRRQKNLE